MVAFSDVGARELSRRRESGKEVEESEGLLEEHAHVSLEIGRHVVALQQITQKSNSLVTFNPPVVR
jgi:hypothetical protein